MKESIFLMAAFIFLTPDIAVAAGETAEVGRMFQECVNSGGRAASTYDAWVAQNGCICPGSSTGSGQRTCSGASGSSGNTGSSGDLVTDSTRNVVQGMMNSNPQQTGIGMMGIGAAILFQSLQSDPAADARRAREAAIAAEQQRRAEEERRAEVLRQQELTKQRILGQLKGTEPSAGLALKMGDSEPASDGHELKLKLGDADNQKPKSDAYNKGFKDASGCYSQNAGPYCMGASADQQQTCVADYRAGFELGDKQRETAMQEAFQAGQQAGAGGGLADGASDPRADGACRTQWVEIYNRGYFQGKQAKTQR
jgi:type II secretory pathway pseudopilin PulG